MRAFEPGTKVVCVDNAEVPSHLTLGKVYTVTDSPRNSWDKVVIDGDQFPDQGWLLHRFKLCEVQGAQPGDTLYPAPASGYPDGNPKTAIGLTKPSFSNVPAPALLPMMKAFADGKAKYGRFNWREKGVTASVYYDAAQRHLMAYWDGEDCASDSKVHHLGHAMACLAIILDAERHGKLNDDRNGQGEFSKFVAELTEQVGA